MIPKYEIYRQGKTYAIYDVANNIWVEEIINYAFGRYSQTLMFPSYQAAERWVKENEWVKENPPK